MKRLLITIISIAILATTATGAFAQGAGPAGGPPGGGKGGGKGERGGMQRFERMHKMEESVFKQLGLDDKQKKDIAALDKTAAEKMKKLMEGMKGGEMTDAKRKEMGTKMKAIMDTRKTGLKKILGEAKYKKYEELMKKEMDKLRKEREKNGAGGEKPGKPRPPKP